MEFPELGQNCHESSCKQLDFLPMKCDACSKIFCRDHIHYNTHSCPESYKKDNQVPVCPLCNIPVPIKKNESPDVVIGQHIDSDCQSDPARKKRKIYTNKCSHKGCKQKELIPVVCDKCRKNFCLKHRFEKDHDCKGFEGTGQAVSNPGVAAIFRSQNNKAAQQTSNNRQQSKPQTTQLSQLGRDLDRGRRERHSQPQRAVPVQSGMSEDEALARAIQMSLSESQQTNSNPAPSQPLTRQEQEDKMLAEAIAASQEQARREQRRRQEAQHNQQNKSSCGVS